MTDGMKFDFFMPVNIISGQDCIKNNKSIFEAMGRTCLIVCGHSSAKKSGALQDVEKILGDSNIKYEVFDKIAENPLTSVCCEGGRLARKTGADFIIGIGGGSPLDAAKAVCVYAANGHITDDGIYSEKLTSDPLPLIVIGTTAGTGSEVSGVSVLTRKDGRKQSVSGPSFYAKYAFADPKYTYTVPRSVTVSTALDALAHAAESMFSPRSDFLSSRFSLLAAKNIFPILKKLEDDTYMPSHSDRDVLYFSSLYAGFALNKGGTGFPHGMGYALTEDHAIPHGTACAVFLPAYMEEAEKADPERCKMFFDVCETDKEGFCSLIRKLSSLDIIISEEKISEYERRWKELKNFKNSPTSFNNHDAAKLMRTLFSANR